LIGLDFGDLIVQISDIVFTDKVDIGF